MANQENLITILSLWAATHDLGYLQGMNELAAIVYLQVVSERYEDPSNVLSQFNNNEFIEHDTYQIFDRMMMIGVADLFIGEKQEGKRKNIFMEFMQEIKNTYSRDDISANPVVKMCHEVFEVYLKIIDPELHGFLRDNGVEPHLFLL